MKSLSFRLVVGVVEGYYHNVAGVAEDALVENVSTLWQQLAAREFDQNNVYVSVIAQPGAVIYHTDWGCPVGGESVVVLSGSANPTFVKDMEQWKETVVKLAKQLKKQLKQSTLSIEFFETDFIYLTD